MSQASKYKVQAQLRKRRRVASELAEFISDDEIDIFEDDDGRLMVTCDACEPWPGELRYGCIACGGAGATPAADALMTGIMVSVEGQRYVPGFDVHRAREHALTLVRGGGENVHDRRRCDLGLAILAALDGQPSECQSDAWGGCINGQVWVHMGPSPCPECRCTGHNLRGHLPAIEWSPSVLRKLACEMRARQTAECPTDETWGTLVHEEMSARSPGWGAGRRTRVADRGAHRAGLSRISARPGNRFAQKMPLDCRISSRGWSSIKRAPSPEQPSRLPRWRRGELDAGSGNATKSEKV